jgi:hypothetical protein
LLVTIFLAVLLVLNKDAAAQDIPVDLELVLAVDVSLSMDSEEQQLQRDGYISAFRNLELIQAINTGPHGQIAVTYVEWSGENFQRIVVPWTLINGEETARAFTAKLVAAPVASNYRTSISGALIFATGLFGNNGYRGPKAIDISGDGANNQGPEVVLAREAAVRRGITINGLPLLFRAATMDSFAEIMKIDDYYQDCVIGGTGAFMIPVRSTFEFGPAIRRKLILEIAQRDVPILHVAGSFARPRADCFSGEKMWDQWMERFYRE